MTQQSKPVEVEEPQAEPSQEEVTERIRALVGALLDAAVPAPNVSHALAYVATELGLAVAGNPVQVFPVVLGGVSSACADHHQGGAASQASDAGSTNSRDERPDGVTIH
jgi:hypothetical protein